VCDILLTPIFVHHLGVRMKMHQRSNRTSFLQKGYKLWAWSSLLWKKVYKRQWYAYKNKVISQSSPTSRPCDEDICIYQGSRNQGLYCTTVESIS